MTFGHCLVLLALVAGCAPAESLDTSYWVLEKTHPHDATAYTQGLVYHEGVLYESTGGYGSSQLRRVEIGTGKVTGGRPLPAEVFAEGLTLQDDRLVQLTWKEQKAYVWSLPALALVDSFAYEGEGWGLTTDGTHLILSDGSATLRFLDPVTRAVVRRVEVRDANGPLMQINELEYVEGEVLANVYQSARIARIDPETGALRGWLDLTSLVPEGKRFSDEEVLNGIAFDPATRRVYVTGKRWPVLYEFRLR